MSRIIRFRRPYFNHTDDKFNCFGYWGVIHHGFESPPSISGCYYKERSDQQFIGLLDCNGKEIYEGDIVKITFRDKHKEIGEIIEDEKYTGFLWYSKYLHGYRIARNDFASREIIGNIYENPELLKASP